MSRIRHSGDLIDVSNDIGVHIYVKLKNQDKMFDALEISKDILEYQPIVFGGSNGNIGSPNISFPSSLV